MLRKIFALTALALPLAFAGCSHPQPVYYAAPPPPAWSDVAQHGFRDGAEAARRDISQGRSADADRHPRFRNPPVPAPAIEDYRHGFRDGYQQVFRRNDGPRY